AIKDGDYRKISNELADIIIIAVHCASIEGIDLLEAVRYKFEIVKKRKWLPPDPDGVVRHVK
ncbi:MAG: hypothetical protein MN733_37485, partial [Nitrososphaera sp.]|nr:hypothetical protein [Nitrososphaera sp.]